MALPKINDTPSYEVQIPSTQQPIKFRPFLVKEQKILLLAMESEDEKQILGAITDTISSCSESPLDINRLTTFDVEYLFTQIRSKSVGETSNVTVKCKHCEAPNEFIIPLDDIKIDVQHNDKKIKISDKYNLIMKYPSYTYMLRDEVLNGNNVEKMYASIRMCLDSLEGEEEKISFKDETKEEIEKFLDQLNSDQFGNIVEFVSNIPRLQHEVNFKCEQCKKDNKINLTGIQDFFT